MKTRIIRMLVLGLLLLGATTIYADGTNPIPWCPISCSPSAAAR